MLGRASEASLVESLVRDARGGVSGSLLVSGEPGIGKTLLLDHARSASDGMRLLETAGAEGESHLGFAGLADLLGAALHLVDGLPEPQAIALRGALALGPPAPGDRFTAYAATLGLLAATAEEEPVLCIVDDAHWLDAESLEALLFVARRLGAEGIALILGARDDVSQRLEDAPLPRLRLSGLARADAAELVARSSQADVAPPVVEALVAGAAGNPLALIEVAGALSPSQLAGTEPLPDPFPVGPYLRDALLRPVLGLPERTRRALLVASADDGAASFLTAALATEGLAMADLEPAERTGVIAIGPTRARFSHPLVRAAVYRSADAPARRAAHRAHAASAAALGESALDRRAWHLALAATGPDEIAAGELDAAGGRATARNGHAAACEAFETAARLTQEAAPRGRRLLTAGMSALAAGDFGRAGKLFDEVVALDAEPAQVLEAMAGRGFVETFSGSARRAVEMLVAAADRVAPVAPHAAAGLLVQAIVPAFMRIDVTRGAALADRAVALADGGPPEVRAAADAASAVVRTFSGDPRDPSSESIALLAASRDPTNAIWVMGQLQSWMLMERYEEAEAGLSALVNIARELSTPSLLPLPLHSRGEVRRRLGRLAEASADASEALALSEDIGQPSSAGLARWLLALIDAVQGRSTECRAQTAGMLSLKGQSEVEILRIYSSQALGLLALSTGDLDEAVHHLMAVDRLHRETGGAHHPLLHTYEQDLVEALIRLGRVEEADGALATFAARAERCGAPWPAAAAARCRGLLADDDAFEDHFAEALAWHARTPTPFERARTELCQGERRRRARRARDARVPLTAALQTFEAHGAEPWAEKARRELRATGARPRRPPPSSSEPLTPQELQVAQAVAGGATNKEAATALLISAKTVEYHLSKVYAKLGVRSRAELAGRMAAAGRVPGD
jgi:DNA-binding CsgD family transcriptional regulator/tetratricopeptide (TPR) repeat protein